MAGLVNHRIHSTCELKPLKPFMQGIGKPNFYKIGMFDRYSGVIPVFPSTTPPATSSAYGL